MGRQERQKIAQNKIRPKSICGSVYKKWTKLETKLKEITDHKNKSGNSHKTWNYFSEMANCIGMSAAVRTTYTLESLSCRLSNEGEESDRSADGNYSSKTPQKKNPRKRQGKKHKQIVCIRDAPRIPREKIRCGKQKS